MRSWRLVQLDENLFFREIFYIYLIFAPAIADTFDVASTYSSRKDCRPAFAYIEDFYTSLQEHAYSFPDLYNDNDYMLLFHTIGMLIILVQAVYKHVFRIPDLLRLLFRAFWYCISNLSSVGLLVYQGPLKYQHI